MSHLRRYTPQFQDDGPTPSFRGEKRAVRQEEGVIAPPLPLYPNSHSQRCLRQSFSQSNSRFLTPSQADRNVETLLAWDARKQLRIQQLRTEVEAAELESATFHPAISQRTVEILMEKDQREAADTERVESHLAIKEKLKQAIMRLPPGTKTHFHAGAFISSSLPSSPRQSCDGPRNVARRNEQWLRNREQKIDLRKREMPPGATFHPRVNTARIRTQQQAGGSTPGSTHSQVSSTKATPNAEDRGKQSTFSARNLSPATKNVSYKAGLDLQSFLTRAKPLIQLRDLGL